MASPAGLVKGTRPCLQITSNRLIVAGRNDEGIGQLLAVFVAADGRYLTEIF